MTEFQRTLKSLYFTIGEEGVFDAATETAIRVIQAARGLPADGVVDAATLEAVAAAVDSVTAGLADAPSTPEGVEPTRWRAREGERIPGIYRTDDFGGQVALTFDDGPSPDHTLRILDILHRADVRATFYVQGVNAVRWPEIVRQVHNEGHLIGNHSWDHPDLTWLTADAAVLQIRRTQDALRKILGNPSVRCVRPPYGSPFLNRRPPYVECWPAMTDVLLRMDAILMMWHVGTWDWKYHARPDLVVERFRTELARSGGGVVLMHDVHPQAVEALPGILDVIRQNGSRVVLDQDLLAQKYEM